MVYENLVRRHIEKHIVIDTHDDMYNLLKEFAKNRQEQSIVVTLDKDRVVLGIYIIGIGTSVACQGNTKEVLLKAHEDKAKFLIRAHNHPYGGDPSIPDLMVGELCRRACVLMDIYLIVELVIRDSGYSVIRFLDGETDKDLILENSVTKGDGSMVYETVITKQLDKRIYIKDYDALYKLVKKHNDSRQEQLVLVTMDLNNVVLGVHLIRLGVVHDIASSAKDIFYKAIIDNAYRVACCYIGEEDIGVSTSILEAADKLFRAGTILGIYVNKQLVVHKNGYSIIAPSEEGLKNGEIIING